MECCIEQCERNAYARELCEPHYRRLQRHGDAFADLPIGSALRTCSVPDCGRPCDGMGLCHGHYQRWQRSGDVAEDVPLGRRRQPTVCTAGNCDRPTKAKGYCSTHYKRALKHGEAQPERPIRIATGQGQRVEDKVEYAVALLRQYRPELLAQGPSVPLQSNVNLSGRAQ